MPTQSTRGELCVGSGLLSPQDLPTFEKLYRQYFRFVWQTARRMGVLDSALDDVCQDVFLAVYRRLPQFEGRSSVKTWIFGFVTNVVQIHNRTLRRKSVAHRANGEVVDPDTIEDPRAYAPDERLNQAQSADIASELLSRLPKDKREVFVLAELGGMSAAEIAQEVNANTSAKTVHTQLRMARQQLHQAVQRYRARDSWRGRVRGPVPTAVARVATLYVADGE